MEELTAGLLFNDTMVMIAGGSACTNNSQQLHEVVNFTTGSDVTFELSGVSSSSSSISSNSPTYYPSTNLPAELFTEFNEFTAFNLGSSNLLASSENSDSERMMEELISSDLSSDEDKFLETIRCGGGNTSVMYTNTLLSEEELVNTIQNYGDVKVVQIDGGIGVGNQDTSVDNVAVEMIENEKKSKKRKACSLSGSNANSMNNKPVKKCEKKPHKTRTESRVFDDTFVDFGSPSPGSPQQQPQVNENGTFQELKLSDEEKRLLMKEGITLPSHYPLTKLEERELKRIRRKIRNKISAQDSRKRKKEFLDRLQHKLQEVEDEKSCLQKRVRSLECLNSKLNAQVKRLQAALSNSTSNNTTSPLTTNKPGGVGGTSIPAATTLLVLILSLALVVLPNSLDKRNDSVVSNDLTSSSSEILSLLNRSSNEVRSKNMDNPIKSRVMVDDDGEEHSYVNVNDLLNQMKSLLKSRGKVRKRTVPYAYTSSSSSSSSSSSGWYESDDEQEYSTSRPLKRTRYRTFQIVDDVSVD